MDDAQIGEGLPNGEEASRDWGVQGELTGFSAIFYSGAAMAYRGHGHGGMAMPAHGSGSDSPSMQILK